MKRILFLPLLAAMAISCNNNKPKNEVVIEEKDGTKLTVNTAVAEDVGLAAQKKAAELRELKPYSLAEMKTFFPEELDGAKRSGYEANATMGTVMGSAEYNTGETSKIKLSVFDCAGPAGSGFYSLQYLGAFQVEKDTEEEYIKTSDFNGARAVESSRKNENESSFMFLGGDRLMVTLEGEGVPVEKLKQIASSLKF
ncbi:MAG: hypothetical protein EOO09_10345 [Chitinophagaceae bacterium]|nr:MAG: hypothetical protein EOO09_10345 [Chitinophagaceae bacterium]